MPASVGSTDSLDDADAVPRLQLTCGSEREWVGVTSSSRSKLSSRRIPVPAMLSMNRFAPMQLSDTPSAVKQIRKASWKFQQTFKTPLNNLQPFVRAILLAASPETACITIEQAVFETQTLDRPVDALLAASALRERNVCHCRWSARSGRAAPHNFRRLVRLPFRAHSQTVRDICRSR